MSSASLELVLGCLGPVLGCLGPVLGCLGLVSGCLGLALGCLVLVLGMILDLALYLSNFGVDIGVYHRVTFLNYFRVDYWVRFWIGLRNNCSPVSG